MSPAKGLVAILKALSPTPSRLVGYTFIIGQASEDENTIGALDSGGFGALPTMNIDWVSVQFIVRGSTVSGSYEKCYEALESIKDALLGIPSAPTAYPELISVTMTGHILPLGYDENRRPVLSLNLRLRIEPSVGAEGHRVTD